MTVKMKEKIEEESFEELDIIAKTRMKGGHCIMALDQKNRFRRPIYTTEMDACCWPPSNRFEVGHRYKFTILRHPEDRKTEALTPYPHRNEDTVVGRDVQMVCS